MGWAAGEFEKVDLGDKRLDSRLIKLCNSFSKVPESPINQACADWADTKAAYRFFKEAVISIAKLGGYLARGKDGPPGTLVLWRGWKRLMDLAEGWSMALML